MAKYRKRKYARRMRRKSLRRRRGMRRRIRKGRRSRRSNVHSFVRDFAFTYTATASATTFGVRTFSFSDLPDVADFTALFDQYRINGVSVKFIPRTTDSGQAAGERGNFYSVVDYDDDSAPTSLNDMRQFQNIRSTRSTSVHKRYLVPAIAVPLYKSSVSFGYGPSRKRWIDLVDTTVPHYGLKWGVENYDNVAIPYDVQCRMYFQVKNVR